MGKNKEEYEEEYYEEAAPAGPSGRPGGFMFPGGHPMTEDGSEKKKKKKDKYKGDVNSKQYAKDVEYGKDKFVPKGRRKPKDEGHEEKGLVIRYPDLVKAAEVGGVCHGIKIDKKRGQKKCIMKLRAEYKKENAVMYTTACNDIKNPFKRKRCIQKYNRGL